MAELDPSMLLMAGAAGLAIVAVTFVVGVLYNALIVWLASKIFKLKNTTFKTALIAALVAGIANLIITFGLGLLVGGGMSRLIGIATSFFVYAFAAKQFYKLEIGKALLVGLVWWVASFVVALIVGIILGVILAAVILGSGGFGGI